ncbi:hypothetical protein BGI05_05160 [Snodgrassella alvi]|uniref:phage tail tape measure protein n=1 Tax=Snodgrassella alvi TaxID=1196083 RepID=UPI000A0334DB|nr:phage tail tape measure protein [Snodgrassella alvi]ORF03606.1 hypothetical protein BGH97_02570 [Snodgrassella alvi]ORF09382.1 hypothetical protein BGH99_02545 [Snodgrassella alvi]ORF14701.1 hypothetical protein BGI00_01800 [Snodgrassella alvi]ORF15905.1 hypothetical protein BGI02_01990 [Snodgrassella alvi]ORF20998.1 hypothetical protein BGI05_05160 [Snodgrassella alvi]
MNLIQNILVKITANADSLSKVFRRSTDEVTSLDNKIRKAGLGGHFRGLINDLRTVRRESRQAYEQMSSLQKEVHRAKQAGAVFTGTMAAAWMLKEPAKKTMDFDLRMRHMSNTAFAGESFAQRKEGAKQLEAAVNDAIRRYGGTRESAANALDSIIASGVMNAEDSMASLPTIQKYSTSFDAESEKMAAIALAGVQNMRVSPKRIDRLFEIAGKGGQLGGYELKDMAKMLPEQTSAAAKVGITGEEGFAHLIALNQVARTAAGTADIAGNNVVNLLEKLKSHDTITAFRKNFDIDLNKEYKNGLLRDKDTLDVFLETIDKIVAQDKRFQKAKAEAAKAAKSGDKSAETWDKIGSVVQSSVIGNVVNDRQAGAALAAMISQREQMGEIRKQVLAAQGVGDDNFALIADSNSFKVNQLSNEKDIKTQAAFEPFNNGLGLASEKLVEFANAFPKFSTALTGAGYGAAALGAAGVSGALFTKLTGGGGGLIGRAASIAGKAAGIAGKAAGTVGKLAGKAVTGAGKFAGNVAIKSGQFIGKTVTGASQFAGKAATSGAGQLAGKTATQIGRGVSGLLSARSSFGMAALFHSEELNKGEDARMFQLQQQYARSKKIPNLAAGLPEINKNRSAMGLGGDIPRQTAQAITKSGDSVVAKAQAIEQALVAQVKASKIEGNITVKITAPPGFGVQTEAKGNNNTRLNLGLAGVGGG